MKRPSILILTCILLLGLMACQITLPQIGQQPLPTLPLETQTPTAEEPGATPPPMETPTEEPATATATSLPPTPTLDAMLDSSRLVLESRTHTAEDASQPGFRFEVTFPVFTAPEDERLTRFNSDVEDIVNNLEANFRQDALAIPYDPNFGTNQSFLEVQYEATFFERGVISIFFDINFYMSGAAHPNSYSLVLNYDLLEGTRLSLVDLFTPGSDYLQALSDYCMAALADEGRLEFPGGALPDAVNYQSWNLTPGGLRVNFDPYQVGPYAMGAQTVTVPYADLAGILRSDGVMGRVTAP